MAMLSGRSLPILTSIDGGRKPLLQCDQRGGVCKKCRHFSLLPASPQCSLVGFQGSQWPLRRCLLLGGRSSPTVAFSRNSPFGRILGPLAGGSFIQSKLPNSDPYGDRGAGG